MKQILNSPWVPIMPTWNWLNLIWNWLAIKKNCTLGNYGFITLSFFLLPARRVDYVRQQNCPNIPIFAHSWQHYKGTIFLKNGSINFMFHSCSIFHSIASTSLKTLHYLKHCWHCASGTVYVVKTQHFGVSLWVCKGCKGSRCLFAWGAIKLPNGVGIDRMFWLSGVGGESLAMSNVCLVGLMFLTNLQMDRRVKVQTKEKHQMPNCFHQGFQPLQWQPS